MRAYYVSHDPGQFYYEIGLGFGKVIWLCAVIIHAVHICIFTYNNVIKNRDINTTVPSWFVTYNGIMVSCVTGGAMNMKPMLQAITVYGIIIYLILIPIMIYRLIKVPVNRPSITPWRSCWRPAVCASSACSIHSIRRADLC